MSFYEFGLQFSDKRSTSHHRRCPYDAYSYADNFCAFILTFALTIFVLVLSIIAVFVLIFFVLALVLSIIVVIAFNLTLAFD